MSLSLSDHNEFHRLQGIVLGEGFTEDEFEEYVALAMIRKLEGRYPQRALAGEFDLGKSFFKKIAKVVRKVVKPLAKVIKNVLKFTPIGLVAVGAMKLTKAIAKKKAKKGGGVEYVTTPPPKRPVGVPADAKPMEYSTPDTPPKSVWVWESTTVEPYRWYQIEGEALMAGDDAFAEFAKKWAASTPAAATAPVTVPVDTATATVAAEAVVQGNALTNMGVQLPQSMQSTIQGAQQLLSSYGSEGNGLVQMAAEDAKAAAEANDAPTEYETAIDLAAKTAEEQILAAQKTPTWVWVAGAAAGLVIAVGGTMLVLRPAAPVMYSRRR